MLKLLAKFYVLSLIASLAQTVCGQVSTGAPVKVMHDELRIYFQKNVSIVESNSTYEEKISFFRNWHENLSEDKEPRKKLITLLCDERKYDAAISLSQPVFEKSDDLYSGRLKIALNLYFEGSYQDSQKIADAVSDDAIKVFVTSYNSNNIFVVTVPAALGQAGAAIIKSRLEIRKKQYTNSIRAIDQGLEKAQAALLISSNYPKNEEFISEGYRSKAIYAALLLQKIRTYYASNSNSDAERTLDQYLQTLKEIEKHPYYYWNTALYKYRKQDFIQSEKLFRKADEAAGLLGYEPLSYFRRDCSQGIVGSLEGQLEWNLATQELQRLDVLAGEDDSLKYRIRYRIERALAYIKTGIKLKEATELLSEISVEISPSGIRQANARGLRALAILKMGDSQKESLGLFEQAISVYLNQLYFDDQSDGLNTLIRNLVISGYLNAAFQSPDANPVETVIAAEWMRNSSVQNALQDAAVRASTKVDGISELVRSDQDLKRQIRVLQTKASNEADKHIEEGINELNLKRFEIQGQIKTIYPSYNALVIPPPLNLEAVRGTLQEDEAIVILMPIDDNVFVWVLTSDSKDQSIKVSLPKAELMSLVKRLRSTLDFGSMGANLVPFDDDAAYQIYDRLLRPIDSSLSGRKHYLIAAGDVLGQIPFGVLLTSLSEKGSTKKSWLINDVAISQIPSVTSWLALKQLAKTPSAPESMAGWGDPLFGTLGKTTENAIALSNPTRHLISQQNIVTRRTAEQSRLGEPVSAGMPLLGSFKYSDIPALPETRGELLAIANILKADPQRDLHFGEYATKASVMELNMAGELLKKKVIAFATHGLMAGDLPLLTQPALALASNDSGDKDPLGALLTLEEVLTLKLNADWVILSACNTAANDGKATDALTGLARGFFYAGSRSLLVTHWAVDSESAKALTTYTMRNYMANPNQRKSESLRQAILAVMSDPNYRHPAYWAPYTLVGDGGR